ncbi:MAG: hypothetical protein LIP23_02530, partial [Planctomycetes bacterium]|nr:hypothetical protein [Planctomycetota bacterium]
MRALAPALLCLAVALAAQVRGGESLATIPFTLDEADRMLAVAERMLEGGIYDRAGELARRVLDAPEARAVEGTPEQIQQWLLRREMALFFYERSRFGLATERDVLLDIAEAMLQLANNRYRLPEPVYNVQAAYWSGRALEQAEEYGRAVEMYSRVGGVALPQGMEGDAAQRTSRSLRMLAEDVPFPGTVKDRQNRSNLLNRAIAELDRARLAFPIGNRRKEIELDLIALRLARREDQYIREAASEAEAFIERDPSRDNLRARAALYRGQAASLLGESEVAAAWFRRVVEEEDATEEDLRDAKLGLALVLVELAASQDAEGRRSHLQAAADALAAALEGAGSGGKWHGARIILADTLLELDKPAAALDALQPVLADERLDHRAWQTAGMAELRRGKLQEAFALLYPSTRPSNPDRRMRQQAASDASHTADLRRDFGMALALSHQASRILRAQRLFDSLLVSEYRAMEIILKLGKMGGPVSLSADIDLLSSDNDQTVVDITARRREAAGRLAQALGALLSTGGDSDSGSDLGIAAETAAELSGPSLAKLQLAIDMISHLTIRRPQGVAESVLSSRLGDARQALALARAAEVLAADEPDMAEINRTIEDFAAASRNFQTAAAGGMSVQDNLEQGVVNMESGGFLLGLAEKWNQGQYSSQSLLWREEARRRIEASLRPFNQTIASSGSSSMAARRARWSRGRALELLGEWRGAAQDYLALMNNSELPRLLRANAARRWAASMDKLGEARQALTRLAAFAESDAESALLDGRMAEASGFPREAYRRYLFAADPAAPAIPPATPWRTQEAAYRAAKLALADPEDINPGAPRAETIAEARAALRENALAHIDGDWTIEMLDLLGENLIEEGEEGWREAYLLAMNALETPGADNELARAMRILAAKALSAGGNHDEALNQLDLGIELVDDSASARRDAAAITLQNARIYRLQGRNADALRAYADVFAVYPDAVEAAEAA